MIWVRKKWLFSRQCPLIELNNINMYLFDTSLWNGNLEYFLSVEIYSTYPSLFCFTETSINDSPAKHINEILHHWKYIHKNTQDSLAPCYNVSKVNTIEIALIPSVLEALLVIAAIDKETILLVIEYCMPCSLDSFIDDFILLINKLPANTGFWLLQILVLIKCFLNKLLKLIL